MCDPRRVEQLDWSPEFYICGRCELVWRTPQTEREARVYAAAAYDDDLPVNPDELSLDDVITVGYDCPGCGHFEHSAPVAEPKTEVIPLWDGLYVGRRPRYVETGEHAGMVLTAISYGDDPDGETEWRARRARIEHIHKLWSTGKVDRANAERMAEAELAWSDPRLAVPPLGDDGPVQGGESGILPVDYQALIRDVNIRRRYTIRRRAVETAVCASRKVCVPPAVQPRNLRLLTTSTKRPERRANVPGPGTRIGGPECISTLATPAARTRPNSTPRSRASWPISSSVG